MFIAEKSGLLNKMKAADTIFWDFDGVIKESVSIKDTAYLSLFSGHGNRVCERIDEHLKECCGRSRFEKIPLYLEWAGERVTDSKVHEYCQRYSSLVFNEILECDWVPGVQEYLFENHERQRFVLVTATPQNEIEEIITELKINKFFEQIIGSPVKKFEAISGIMSRIQLDGDQCLMIGDSETDFYAAKLNKIPFFLRLTERNHYLRNSHDGQCFRTFYDE